MQSILGFSPPTGSAGWGGSRPGLRTATQVATFCCRLSLLRFLVSVWAATMLWCAFRFSCVFVYFTFDFQGPGATRTSPPSLKISCLYWSWPTLPPLLSVLPPCPLARADSPAGCQPCGVYLNSAGVSIFIQDFIFLRIIFFLYCFVSFSWWHLTFWPKDHCQEFERLILKLQHLCTNGEARHKGSQPLIWHLPISTSWLLTFAVKVPASASFVLFFLFFFNKWICKTYLGELVNEGI